MNQHRRRVLPCSAADLAGAVTGPGLFHSLFHVSSSNAFAFHRFGNAFQRRGNAHGRAR